MIYTLAFICTCLLLISLFLLFLGLPGLWCMLVVLGVWSFLVSGSGFTSSFFILWVVLALAAEVIEFAAGYFGAKKFGGSTQGSIGGMIGALVGGILCAPFFFGLGALFGALLGGFTGCFIVEKAYQKETVAAMRAAWGVTLGRFGGFVVKLAVGVSLLFHALPILWQ